MDEPSSAGSGRQQPPGDRDLVAAVLAKDPPSDLPAAQGKEGEDAEQTGPRPSPVTEPGGCDPDPGGHAAHQLLQLAPEAVDRGAAGQLVPVPGLPVVWVTGPACKLLRIGSALFTESWAAAIDSLAKTAAPSWEPGTVASGPDSVRIKVPVSRFSAATIASILVAVGLVATISVRTVQRWLKADKLKPWRFRSWITPKDLSTFLERACPVLDLYERVAKGRLEPGERVYCTDEKTSIQARHHASYQPSGAGEPAHVEHTYQRRGAVQLLAALDVATGKVLGRVELRKRFIEFSALLRDLITTALAEGAQLIHLILDNGSTHRPKYLEQWLAENFHGVRIQVHWLPVRSSWLDQIEIFFGVLQQQALTPSDFASTDEAKTRILDFIAYRNPTAKPIKWTYTSPQLRAKYQRERPRDMAA